MGGFHFHCCVCGNLWRHADACHGDERAHTCTRCGEKVWGKYRPDAGERGKARTRTCAALRARVRRVVAAVMPLFERGEV